MQYGPVWAIVNSGAFHIVCTVMLWVQTEDPIEQFWIPRGFLTGIVKVGGLLGITIIGAKLFGNPLSLREIAFVYAGLMVHTWWYLDYALKFWDENNRFQRNKAEGQTLEFDFDPINLPSTGPAMHCLVVVADKPFSAEFGCSMRGAFPFGLAGDNPIDPYVKDMKARQRADGRYEAVLSTFLGISDVTFMVTLNIHATGNHAEVMVDWERDVRTAHRSSPPHLHLISQDRLIWHLAKLRTAIQRILST